MQEHFKKTFLTKKYAGMDEISHFIMSAGLIFSKKVVRKNF